MPELTTCPICDGKGEVHDYNAGEHAWVPRTCPNCKGLPWPPKPKPRVALHPTYTLALAAITYRSYVSECEGRGLVPVKLDRFCAWRRRAKQRAAGKLLQ